jgi:hypothetical protein
MEPLLTFLTNLLVGVAEAVRFWAEHREAQSPVPVQVPPPTA